MRAAVYLRPVADKSGGSARSPSARSLPGSSGGKLAEKAPRQGVIYFPVRHAYDVRPDTGWVAPGSAIAMV